MYFAKKKKKKGFTLIELLVVIAIIGILATIVIVNVNSARLKAQDTAIKGSLDSLRAGAEIFYDTGSTYVGLCTSADYSKATTSIYAITSVMPTCNASSDGYVITSNLKTSSQYWCVDSKGNSVQKTSITAGAYCQ